MSYTTYQEQRDSLERAIARYQVWIEYLEKSDKTVTEKAEGIATTKAAVKPIKAELADLNMGYYGTTVLYR
jgi:prefoldin subunit 5